jgi:biotin transport system substrate-specific component
LETKYLVKTALMAALMASTGFFAIPVGPVPITLQTFFSLLAGVVLGPLYGAVSMILYVILGVLGLPVFSKGQSGIGVVLGPTGGFIVGFIFAAWLIGILTSKNKNDYPKILIAMLGGVIVIYLFGLLQFVLVTKTPFSQAILAVVIPFIPIDAVKAVFAAVVGKRLSALDS